MHIHGPSIDLHAAGLARMAGAEKAGSAERAAETRRKLARSAQEAAATGSPDETLMIGQWTDSRHSQTQSADEYRTTLAGKDLDFG